MDGMVAACLGYDAEVKTTANRIADVQGQKARQQAVSRAAAAATLP
jgi:hypothetical protein